jgi:hypothetical protein
VSQPSDPATGPDRPVSDGTIARIYATLRAALNAAVRQGTGAKRPNGRHGAIKKNATVADN